MQIWSFVHKREVGEVVFTLRMAYQSSNNARNVGIGSLYSAICVFASEITRQRNAIISRAQAEAARRRQLHRQELEAAREHAAAEALVDLKRNRQMVRGLFFSSVIY